MLAQDMFVAVQPDIVPVKSMGDIAKGITVRGTILGSHRFTIAGEGTVGWALDVALEGGLKGSFGCSRADQALLGSDEDALKNMSFIAVVTSGPGPQVDDLDFEPTRVFYLSGFVTSPGFSGPSKTGQAHFSFDIAS